MEDEEDEDEAISEGRSGIAGCVIAGRCACVRDDADGAAAGRYGTAAVAAAAVASRWRTRWLDMDETDSFCSDCGACGCCFRS